VSAPFQEMPALDPATEAALRASIERFGVLVPVVRDQHGRTIDGHHRARIADELGVAYPSDTVQVDDDDQARESVALGIEEIAKSCGLRIAPTNKVHGTISAVSDLREIYAMSPDLLSDTLTVIVRSWGLEDTDARSRAMLVGVARFLRNASPKWRGKKPIESVKVNLEDLVSNLKKEKTYSILRDARSLAKDTNLEVRTATAREILRIYNKGRRSGRLNPSGHLFKGGWS
jgi:hypothetical protein